MLGLAFHHSFPGALPNRSPDWSIHSWSPVQGGEADRPDWWSRLHAPAPTYPRSPPHHSTPGPLPPSYPRPPPPSLPQVSPAQGPRCPSGKTARGLTLPLPLSRGLASPVCQAGFRKSPDHPDPREVFSRSGNFILGTLGPRRREGLAQGRLPGPSVLPAGPGAAGARPCPLQQASGISRSLGSLPPALPERELFITPAAPRSGFVWTPRDSRS